MSCSREARTEIKPNDKGVYFATDLITSVPSHAGSPCPPVEAHSDISSLSFPWPAQRTMGYAAPGGVLLVVVTSSFHMKNIHQRHGEKVVCHSPSALPFRAGVAPKNPSSCCCWVFFFPPEICFFFFLIVFKHSGRLLFFLSLLTEFSAAFSLSDRRRRLHGVHGCHHPCGQHSGCVGPADPRHLPLL